jgi:hypothetical protein
MIKLMPRKLFISQRQLSVRALTWKTGNAVLLAMKYQV